MLNRDYREMLQCLADEKVKFLVVGTYALAVHGYPRATKDIEFFVWANPENAASLFRALSGFGAPLKDLSAADFASEGAVYQIGSGPRRMTSSLGSTELSSKTHTLGVSPYNAKAQNSP